MADDEDVIFKDSMLYDHLKEAGFQELDIDAQSPGPGANPMSQHEAPLDDQDKSVTVMCNNSQDDQDSEEVHVHKNNSRIKNNIKKAVNGYLWGETCKKEVNQLHQKDAEGLIEAVLQCPILEDEDAAYIDSFAASFDLGRGSENQEESDRFLAQVLPQMGILGISLAYGCFRMVYMKSEDASSQLFVWALDIIAVALTVICLMPSTLRFAWAGRVIRKLRGFCGCTGELLADVAIWDKVTRRTVRLVQETELVARGFTMVTPQIPITRLESSSSSLRQCPQLRKNAFLTARKVMLDFKAATSDLIKKFPSHVELEGLSSYLASMPLKDYGPCVMLKDGPKLYEATDAYCLSAIKEMLNLCNTHISEFLRVLSLACLLRAEDHFQNIGFIDQVEVVKSMHHKLNNHITPLHRLYRLIKNLLASEERKDKPKTQTELGAVYIAVHSLTLHLQAALRRVQSADERISQEEDSGQTTLTPDLGLDLTRDLKVLESELEACQDCLREGVNRVDKALGKAGPPKSSTDPAPASVPDPLQQNQAPPIPLCGPEGEPIIVDQVFEAYTDPTEVDADTGTDNVLSEEEKAQQKRERQEAIRVLKELRSVIAVRAVDREERERQALRRQYPDSAGKEETDGQMEGDQKGTSSLGINDSGCDGARLQGSESQSEHTTKLAEDFQPCGLQETECSLPKENTPKDIWSELTDDNTDNTKDVASLEENESQHKPNLEDLKYKLAGIGGGDLAFSSSVAAMAVARSRQMAAMSEDTFGGEGEVDLSGEEEDDQDIEVTG